MQSVRRPIRSTIHEHLWGPAGSLLLHALLILALLHFIRDRKPPEEEETIFASLTKAPDPLPDLEIVRIDDPEGEKPEEGKNLGETLKQEPIQTVPPGTVVIDIVPLPQPPTSPLPPITTGSLTPTAWSQRREANTSKATPESEAIVKALDWLRDHQNPDGSWGRSQSVGYTGLALLTFLAHGETPASEHYGIAVERGLLSLLGQMKEDGRFQAAAGHSYVYEHAIATYALAEMHGLTRIPQVRQACERAVPVILRGQTAGGAWGYDYDPATTRADTSVTAWQVQALKAASISGLHIAGVEEALAKSLDGLNGLFREPEQVFDYSSVDRRTNAGLNAAAGLCFQLNGAAGRGNTGPVLRALSAQDPDFLSATGWPFYAAYYQAQAVFHSGPAAFAPWGKRCMSALMRRQDADGSWKSASASEGGTDDLTRRVYATTLSALTLQVRTRTHLGTGKIVEQSAAKAIGGSDDIDIDLRLSL